MTLSERIAQRAGPGACRDNDAQDGWCMTHRGGAFDGRGTTCDYARRAIPQSPFTRRALRGELPAKEVR